MNARYFDASYIVFLGDFYSSEYSCTPRGIDEECFINLYKSIHGVKPRWMDLTSLTDEELSAEIDRLGQYTGCDDDFRTDPEDVEFYREVSEYWRQDDAVISELEAPLTELELLELELSS